MRHFPEGGSDRKRGSAKLQLKGLDPVCLFFRSFCRIIGALCMSHSLLGQSKTTPVRPQPRLVSVPFIGCNSDGQAGPIEAPTGTSISLLAGRDVQKLAFYKPARGVGALAPRGWYCFGTYGSGGDTLYITPRPINTANVFSAGPGGSDGPAIQVAYRFGGTSGRFDVAEIVARVFPAFRSFATEVMQEFDLPDERFVFHPYPADKLVYKNKALVEYRTPAQAAGLGTYSWLSKNTVPIDGAAMLVGDEHDLALLSVRLPVELNGLTRIIIGQFERNSARCPCE
jgi:hypothetical protein